MRAYVSQAGKYTGKTTLLVKFSPRTKRKLKRRAAKEGMSMSELVRQATEEYLQNQ